MAGGWKKFFYGITLAAVVWCLAPRAAQGQLALPDAAAAAVPNPLVDATANPGKVLLFDLEARFARDVQTRGGAAYADWFAEDGVLLGNGAAPVTGRVAIARFARWRPEEYQLTWTPVDAVMSPSGDMGYTWSHYEGRSKDATVTGRLITIWRKQPNGDWKVSLSAGANEPAAAGDCCRVPAGQSR